MNRWVGVGRLVKAPNFRFAPEKGIAVCDFTIAIKKPLKGENKADFIKVVTFGRLADTCNSYLDKGRRVGVEGHISTGDYMDQSGRKVYTWNIIADTVEFLWSDDKPSRPKQQEQPQEQPQFDMIDEEIPF